MKTLLTLLIVMGATRVALAFDVVLISDTSKTKIEMTDLPGGSGLFLVAWDNLPGPTPSGAMVYYKDPGQSETRYFAVGGGGLFAVVDRGERTWVSGTRVPVFDVITTDPERPAKMKVELGRKIDVAALTARYGAFEHVAAAGETKSTIETAVAASAARANKACGGKLAVQIQWPEFVKAGKVAYAKQASSIFDAIETTCADKDYRAALRAVTTLRIELGSGALELAVKGATVTAKLSDKSFNPRETAQIWFANHL